MKDKIIAELEASYTNGRSIASIISFRRELCHDYCDTDYVTVRYADNATEEIELDTDWSTFLNTAYGV